jgi:hypothetical protein
MCYDTKKKIETHCLLCQMLNVNQITLSRSKHITEKSQYEVTQSINSGDPQNIQIQKFNCNRIDSHQQLIGEVQ